jgi:CO dehydrogenase/acetyl-CoA synthase gamma subunit (corrinoid Fe-S protein)
MRADEARELIKARVDAGGRLVAARQADLQNIKNLQAQCHQAGIPTVLAPCPGGG